MIKPQRTERDELIARAIFAYLEHDISTPLDKLQRKAERWADATIASRASGRGAEAVKPQRIQLSRRRGFDLQAASRALNGLPAVNCARPSRYGNPYKISQLSGLATTADEARKVVVRWFRLDLIAGAIDAITDEDIDTLRGKNLACWCRLDQPCHCDVLLEVANQEPTT